MKNNKFALKGTFIYSENRETLALREEEYLLVSNGVVEGFSSEKPVDMPVYDYSGKIIIPGMYDLHTHASQFAYRGLGMDMELLEWLYANAFPEEAKFEDLDYAEKAYEIFVNQLVKSPTAGACVFAEIHEASTLLLMEKLEKSGLQAYVGKVNMDRDCPDYIRETTEGSLAVTESWIEKSKGFKNVKPVITPRFIPSCTDELMTGLSALREKYGLSVQSHLSENPDEIELVKKLCPESESYIDAYRLSGIIGKNHKTVMAHCVYSDSEDEIRLLKENNIFIAHCPQCNANVMSGIAPVRKYIEAGLDMGLGTDCAGGASLSMFREMTDAIQASKLYWRLVDKNSKPLTFPEAFYLATEGGGRFFGNCGSFKKGYTFSAVALNEENLETTRSLNPFERLERLIYLSDGRNIEAKFVANRKII